MTQNSSLELVRQAVLSFVRAETWQESKRIVTNLQNVLLTDQADDVFAMLLGQHGDDARAMYMLEDHRQLLHRCRVEGIEAAFAERFPPSPEALADKLLTFVCAVSWSESKAYLAEHPELLTDEALVVLERLIRRQEHEEPRRILRQHRALLAEARQKGLDEAFAPLMRQSPSESLNTLTGLMDALIECDNPAAVVELGAQHPNLFVDEMDELLQQAIANARAKGTQQSEGWANHAAQRHETLRQLREMMAETGMSPKEVLQEVRAEQESASQEEESFSRQVFEIVQAFVHPATWHEKRRIVEQEYELLFSDMALAVFADLLEHYKEDAESIRILTDHRQLLIRCRKEGTRAAFAERVGGTRANSG